MNFLKQWYRRRARERAERIAQTYLHEVRESSLLGTTRMLFPRTKFVSILNLLESKRRVLIASKLNPDWIVIDGIDVGFH